MTRGYTPSVAQQGGRSNWRHADMDLDGTKTVNTVLPAGGIYVFANGWNARRVTIGTGIRVRACNCLILSDVLTLAANAILDADGNADGSTTNLNAAGGDLFGGIGTGGALRNTTGAGTAGAGSGGNSSGGSGGKTNSAGAQLGTVTTALTTLSAGINKNFFRSLRFGEVLRTQGSTTHATVNGGQGGPSGAVDLGAGGSGTSPVGGGGGGPMVIKARSLVLAAGARISARGGAGTVAVAVAPGIASASAPGGPGSLWIEVDMFDAHATAVIDADSGAIASGANGGNASYLATPGDVVMFIAGKPAPRRRVLFTGDSKVVGTGNANTVVYGGYRAWCLHGKTSGNLPWRPVGSQQNGNFMPNEMCGVTGETIAQTAARIGVDAPQFLVDIPGWAAPVVVLDIGTNDVVNAVATGTSVAAYTTMLNSIVAANPAALIFVCSQIDRNTSTAGINTLNTALRAMWAARPEWGVTMFEINLNTAVGAYSVTNYADGTHLNEEGHILASTAIRAAWTARSI